MKVFLISIFLLFISHCSFDNKTGIWKNKDEVINKKKNEYKGFKKIYTEEKLFNQIIPPDKSLKILLDPVKLSKKWSDEFYQDSNNSDNFGYKKLNEKIFKSKKLSRYKIKDKILFDGENFLITDIKGNLIIYSTKYQKIIFKYNFYKKKFKKLEKILSIAVNENVVYIADNLGYTYAINYLEKKLLWAKNYKIPFRSNVKIFKDKVIIADLDNTLYFLDKFNGNKIKSLPTEEISIKNQFINSIAVNNDTLFYLNTFGSIYSINTLGRINWFLNINQHSEIDTNNLFNSKPLIVYKDKLIVSSEKYLYIFNSSNGSRLVKIPVSSIVKPLVSNKSIFLMSKNNLLVCINTENGKINYSLDITEEISNFLNTKKKEIQIKDILVANNKIFIFLNNSYFLKFNISGKLENVNKLPTKINTQPILINGSLLYLDNKNQISLVD